MNDRWKIKKREKKQLERFYVFVTKAKRKTELFRYLTKWFGTQEQLKV